MIELELRDPRQPCVHGYTLSHMAIEEPTGWCHGGALFVIKPLWDPVDVFRDWAEDQALVATWEFGHGADAHIPPLYYVP